jgi:hypothetical protein
MFLFTYFVRDYINCNKVKATVIQVSYTDKVNISVLLVDAI